MKSIYDILCVELRVPADLMNKGTWQQFDLELEGDEYSLYYGARGHVEYDMFEDKQAQLLRHIEVYEIKNKAIPLIWKEGL